MKRFPSEFSSFCFPMDFIMTIRTKNLKICPNIIFMIHIFVMSFKDVRNFIISTFFAFFKLFSINGFRRSRFVLMISVTIISSTFARAMLSLFVGRMKECFATLQAGTFYLFLFCPDRFAFMRTSFSRICRRNSFKFFVANRTFNKECGFDNSFGPTKSRFCTFCRAMLRAFSKYFSTSRAFLFKHFSFLESSTFFGAASSFWMFVGQKIFRTNRACFDFIHAPLYHIA